MIKEPAKQIDPLLLHPAVPENNLKAGYELARRYDIASVCIKPYIVKPAVQWLAGSDGKIGAVIGFPFGNSTTSIKVKETETASADGSDEIDSVNNVWCVSGQDS